MPKAAIVHGQIVVGMDLTGAEETEKKLDRISDKVDKLGNSDPIKITADTSGLEKAEKTVQKAAKTISSSLKDDSPSFHKMLSDIDNANVRNRSSQKLTKEFLDKRKELDILGAFREYASKDFSGDDPKAQADDLIFQPLADALFKLQEYRNTIESNKRNLDSDEVKQAQENLYKALKTFNVFSEYLRRELGVGDREIATQLSDRDVSLALFDTAKEAQTQIGKLRYQINRQGLDNVDKIPYQSLINYMKNEVPKYDESGVDPDAFIEAMQSFKASSEYQDRLKQLQSFVRTRVDETKEAYEKLKAEDQKLEGESKKKKKTSSKPKQPKEPEPEEQEEKKEEKKKTESTKKKTPEKKTEKKEEPVSEPKQEEKAPDKTISKPVDVSFSPESIKELESSIDNIIAKLKDIPISFNKAELQSLLDDVNGVAKVLNPASPTTSDSLRNALNKKKAEASTKASEQKENTTQKKPFNFEKEFGAIVRDVVSSSDLSGDQKEAFRKEVSSLKKDKNLFKSASSNTWTELSEDLQNNLGKAIAKAGKTLADYEYLTKPGTDGQSKIGSGVTKGKYHDYKSADNLEDAAKYAYTVVEMAKANLGVTSGDIGELVAQAGVKTKKLYEEELFNQYTSYASGKFGTYDADSTKQLIGRLQFLRSNKKETDSDLLKNGAFLESLQGMADQLAAQTVKLDKEKQKQVIADLKKRYLQPKQKEPVKQGEASTGDSLELVDSSKKKEVEKPKVGLELDTESVNAILKKLETLKESLQNIPVTVDSTGLEEFKTTVNEIKTTLENIKIDIPVSDDLKSLVGNKSVNEEVAKKPEVKVKDVEDSPFEPFLYQIDDKLNSKYDLADSVIAQLQKARPDADMEMIRSYLDKQISMIDSDYQHLSVLEKRAESMSDKYNSDNLDSLLGELNKVFADVDQVVSQLGEDSFLNGDIKGDLKLNNKYSNGDDLKQKFSYAVSAYKGLMQTFGDQLSDYENSMQFATGSNYQKILETYSAGKKSKQLSSLASSSLFSSIKNNISDYEQDSFYSNIFDFAKYKKTKLFKDDKNLSAKAYSQLESLLKSFDVEALASLDGETRRRGGYSSKGGFLSDYMNFGWDVQEDEIQKGYEKLANAKKEALAKTEKVDGVPAGDNGKLSIDISVEDAVANINKLSSAVDELKANLKDITLDIKVDQANNLKDFAQRLSNSFTAISDAITKIDTLKGDFDISSVISKLESVVPAVEEIAASFKSINLDDLGSRMAEQFRGLLEEAKILKPVEAGSRRKKSKTNLVDENALTGSQQEEAVQKLKEAFKNSKYEASDLQVDSSGAAYMQVAWENARGELVKYKAEIEDYRDLLTETGSLAESVVDRATTKIVSRQRKNGALTPEQAILNAADKTSGNVSVDKDSISISESGVASFTAKVTEADGVVKTLKLDIADLWDEMARAKSGDSKVFTKSGGFRKNGFINEGSVLDEELAGVSKKDKGGTIISLLKDQLSNLQAVKNKYAQEDNSEVINNLISNISAEFASLSAVINDAGNIEDQKALISGGFKNVDSLLTAFDANDGQKKSVTMFTAEIKEYVSQAFSKLLKFVDPSGDGSLQGLLATSTNAITGTINTELAKVMAQMSDGSLSKESLDDMAVVYREQADKIRARMARRNKSIKEMIEESDEEGLEEATQEDYRESINKYIRFTQMANSARFDGGNGSFIADIGRSQEGIISATVVLQQFGDQCLAARVHIEDLQDILDEDFNVDASRLFDLAQDTGGFQPLKNIDRADLKDYLAYLNKFNEGDFTADIKSLKIDDDGIASFTASVINSEGEVEKLTYLIDTAERSAKGFSDIADPAGLIEADFLDTGVSKQQEAVLDEQLKYYAQALRNYNQVQSEETRKALDAAKSSYEYEAANLGISKQFADYKAKAVTDLSNKTLRIAPKDTRQADDVFKEFDTRIQNFDASNISSKMIDPLKETMQRLGYEIGEGVDEDTVRNKFASIVSGIQEQMNSLRDSFSAGFIDQSFFDETVQKLQEVMAAFRELDNGAFKQTIKGKELVTSDLKSNGKSLDLANLNPDDVVSALTDEAFKSGRLFKGLTNAGLKYNNDGSVSLSFKAENMATGEIETISASLETVTTSAENATTALRVMKGQLDEVDTSSLSSDGFEEEYSKLLQATRVFNQSDKTRRDEFAYRKAKREFERSAAVQNADENFVDRRLSYLDTRAGGAGYSKGMSALQSKISSADSLLGSVNYGNIADQMISPLQEKLRESAKDLIPSFAELALNPDNLSSTMKTATTAIKEELDRIKSDMKAGYVDENAYRSDVAALENLLTLLKALNNEALKAKNKDGYLIDGNATLAGEKISPSNFSEGSAYELLSKQLEPYGAQIREIKNIANKDGKVIISFEIEDNASTKVQKLKATLEDVADFTGTKGSTLRFNAMPDVAPESKDQVAFDKAYSLLAQQIRNKNLTSDDDEYYRLIEMFEQSVNQLQVADEYKEQRLKNLEAYANRNFDSGRLKGVVENALTNTNKAAQGINASNISPEMMGLAASRIRDRAKSIGVDIADNVGVDDFKEVLNQLVTLGDEAAVRVRQNLSSGFVDASVIQNDIDLLNSLRDIYKELANTQYQINAGGKSLLNGNLKNTLGEQISLEDIKNLDDYQAVLDRELASKGLGLKQITGDPRVKGNTVSLNLEVVDNATGEVQKATAVIEGYIDAAGRASSSLRLQTKGTTGDSDLKEFESQYNTIAQSVKNGTESLENAEQKVRALADAFPELNASLKKARIDSFAEYTKKSVPISLPNEKRLRQGIQETLKASNNLSTTGLAESLQGDFVKSLNATLEKNDVNIKIHLEVDDGSLDDQIQKIRDEAKKELKTVENNLSEGYVDPELANRDLEKIRKLQRVFAEVNNPKWQQNTKGYNLAGVFNLKDLDLNQDNAIENLVRKIEQAKGRIVDSIGEIQEKNGMMFVDIESRDFGANNIQRYTVRLEQLEDALGNVTLQARELPRALRTVETPGQALLSDYKNKIAQLMTYLSGMDIARTMWQTVKGGFSFTQELDSLMTTIGQTTDITKSGLENLSQGAINQARQLGVTVEEVTGAIDVYASMGETTESLLSKSAPTTMMAKAAGMDISQASDVIQGVTRQFSELDGQETSVVNTLEKISANMKMNFGNYLPLYIEIYK